MHRTEVQYAVARIYVAGFIRSGRLELAIDLRRRVEHPLLREAFSTTASVITHRMRVETLDELATLEELITEAHDTAGPGTR